MGEGESWYGWGSVGTSSLGSVGWQVGVINEDFKWLGVGGRIDINKCGKERIDEQLVGIIWDDRGEMGEGVL